MRKHDVLHIITGFVSTGLLLLSLCSKCLFIWGSFDILYHFASGRCSWSAFIRFKQSLCLIWCSLSRVCSPNESWYLNECEIWPHWEVLSQLHSSLSTVLTNDVSEPGTQQTRHIWVQKLIISQLAVKNATNENTAAKDFFILLYDNEYITPYPTGSNWCHNRMFCC